MSLKPHTTIYSRDETAFRSNQHTSLSQTTVLRSSALRGPFSGFKIFQVCREPTQTTASSQQSYRRHFGSLSWLRASEHPTLDMSVQGRESGERSDAANSQVPLQLSLWSLSPQPLGICSAANTYLHDSPTHTTPLTPLLAERTTPKKQVRQPRSKGATHSSERT